MESNLRNIKDILDETIRAEKRCYELMSFLLRKENKLFQSPILDKVSSALDKLSNAPPSDILKELEADYDK